MDNTPSSKPLARDKIAQVYRGELGDGAFQKRTRDRIHWFVDMIDHGPVLDIGCSEGILPILLGKRGIVVVGVDINPDAIEYAGKLLDTEEPSTAAHVTFVCDDIFHTNLEGMLFAFVTIGEILEHFADPGQLIKQAVRFLEPGGTLLVTTPFGYLPDPDHRFTFTVSTFLEHFRPHNLTPVNLSVVDGYIRFAVMNSPSQPEQWENTMNSILEITELGLLDDQRRQRLLIDNLLDERQELYAQVRKLRQQYGLSKKELNRAEAEIVRIKSSLTEILEEKRDIVARNKSLEADLNALEKQNAALVYDNHLVKEINRKITSGLSYEISREFSTSIKPVRMGSLLLPLRLARLVWRRYRRKSK